MLTLMDQLPSVQAAQLMSMFAAYTLGHLLSTLASRGDPMRSGFMYAQVCRHKAKNALETIYPRLNQDSLVSASGKFHLPVHIYIQA